MSKKAFLFLLLLVPGLAMAQTSQPILVGGAGIGHGARDVAPAKVQERLDSITLLEPLPYDSIKFVDGRIAAASKATDSTDQLITYIKASENLSAGQSYCELSKRDALGVNRSNANWEAGQTAGLLTSNISHAYIYAYWANDYYTLYSVSCFYMTEEGSMSVFESTEAAGQLIKKALGTRYFKFDDVSKFAKSRQRT